YFYNIPDVIALNWSYPVVEPFINYLDQSFWAEDTSGIVLTDIVSYGYPLIDSIPLSNEMDAFKYIGHKVENIDKRHPYPINANTYFISQPHSIQGLSGAPAFYKFKLKDGQ